MTGEQPAIVLFASCTADLLPQATATAADFRPELPLLVVHSPSLRVCRDHSVEAAFVVLQPGQPMWRLLLAALRLRPRHLFLMNENLDYFELDRDSVPTLARHLRWRIGQRRQRWRDSPGVLDRAKVWVRHPLVTLAYLKAVAAGFGFSLGKATAQVCSEPATFPVTGRPPGISVVIPSRNGREMLARAISLVLEQLEAGEVIVVDNGSTDGTAAFLRSEFPRVEVLEHSEPLGFPVAVNIGLRRARFEYICLLNNDMAIGPGYFHHLLDAFERIPDLFSANPQVFLPPGVARQETGKSVIRAMPALTDFPVRCDFPDSREDLTWVIYGSSGCSLFHADRLMALHGVDETYHPAYVEDLDLGVRAWQQGWPTVFVAAAHVVHEHRATMSRLFSAEALEYMVLLHWMLFLARTVRDREVFRRYWRHAVSRLFHASVAGSEHALRVLRQPGFGAKWRNSPGPVSLPDADIFALCDGSVVVFPGAWAKSGDKPVLLIVSTGPAEIGVIREGAAEWRQVVVCVSGDAPSPELLGLVAEVVAVRHQDASAPSFQAAVRQTTRRWRPSVTRRDP